MPATLKQRSGSRSTKSRNSSSSRMGKDALTLLKEDHQKVRKMLKRLQSNGTEALLNQVETELKIHTQIEEEIFYPAFRDALRSHKDEHLYFEAIEEHHVVDLVLPEIGESSEGSEEFDAKAKVLKDLVEHHAEEEEKQMFPKARKVMNASQLRQLGEELQERKQDLMGYMGVRMKRRAA